MPFAVNYYKKGIIVGIWDIMNVWFGMIGGKI